MFKDNSIEQIVKNAVSKMWESKHTIWNVSLKGFASASYNYLGIKRLFLMKLLQYRESKLIEAFCIRFSIMLQNIKFTKTKCLKKIAQNKKC